ncbi:hypothetical protein Tco_1242328, partial [Tanacetum coccineum]
VFSIWMAFEGSTRNFGSFGEETDKTTYLHQIVLTERGDGVTSIKRRHRDLSADAVRVRELTTASGRNRLNSDLEDSTL